MKTFRLPGRILLLAAALGGLVSAVPSARAGASDITIDVAKDRTGFLSEPTYRRLELAQTLLAKGDKAKAMDNLERAFRATRDTFERAVILRTQANLMAGGDEPFESVPYFEQALKLDRLTLAETGTIVYNLALLYASKEQFEETLAYLALWRPLTKEVPYEAHMLSAAAYSSLKRYGEAVVELNAAIAKAKTPTEQPYQMLVSMYASDGRQIEAVHTLERMLALWPMRPNYWKQLIGLNSALERQDFAFSAYEMAFALGLLATETDVLNAANLAVYLEVPIKAVRLIETNMASGVVQKTAKNYETLGNALLRAQETERAIRAYRQSTALESNPKLDMMAAQLLMDLEKWSEAIATLEHIVGEDGFALRLENPGLAYVLLGSAHFESNHLDEAAKAFEAGLSFEPVKGTCKQWLESIAATRAAREAQADEA